MGERRELQFVFGFHYFIFFCFSGLALVLNLSLIAAWIYIYIYITFVPSFSDLCFIHTLLLTLHSFPVHSRRRA